MYCKFYIHGSNIEKIVSVFEKRFGVSEKKHRTYYYRQFEIELFKNDEADRNKMRTYPDGFLYYENIAEVEIYSEYIRITDAILTLLWDNNMPAVACCDYEEELNRYIFSL